MRDGISAAAERQRRADEARARACPARGRRADGRPGRCSCRPPAGVEPLLLVGGQRRERRRGARLAGPLDAREHAARARRQIASLRGQRRERRRLAVQAHGPRAAARPPRRHACRARERVRAARARASARTGRTRQRPPPARRRAGRVGVPGIAAPEHATSAPRSSAERCHPGRLSSASDAEQRLNGRVLRRRGRSSRRAS